VNENVIQRLLEGVLERLLVDFGALFSAEETSTLVDPLFLDPSIFSPILQFQSLCKALNYKRYENYILTIYVFQNKGSRMLRGLGFSTLTIFIVIY